MATIRDIKEIQTTLEKVHETNGQCLTDQVHGAVNKQRLRDAIAILDALEVIPRKGRGLYDSA